VVIAVVVFQEAKKDCDVGGFILLWISWRVIREGEEVLFSVRMEVVVSSQERV